MASLHYLWSQRARFPAGSSAFFKAWAKRMLLLYDVMQRNYRRHKLVRKGAMIHERAEIGELRVEGNCAHLKIGQLSFLGQVHLALHAKVEIGERVCINDGVEILTASHDISDPAWKVTKGAIVIEDYAWIGTGAMILPGVHIGQGAVVGARAVVSKSVAPQTIVVGNPARPVSKSRCRELHYNPCEFLAANRAWLLG